MMSLLEQLLVLCALSSIPFSYGQRCNLFARPTTWQEWSISFTIAVMHFLFVLLGTLLGRWIIGFSGSMAFALGVATMVMVGVRMVFDALKRDFEERAFKLGDPMALFFLSFVASVNLFILSIGLVVFVNEVWLLGGMAFVVSLLATLLGIRLGRTPSRYKVGKIAMIIGGVVLVLIALTHLFHAYL
ncbi:MAG: hypothetical protein CSA95_01195 [Bacteroidetes bacterium]|nr:MAG: hypothetical protein CSA95_01195 [Bacteroidota bacterium]PIE88182.1 MAG: hypothetical protein CSA04_03215 [Bacteroidota bacterium]